MRHTEKPSYTRCSAEKLLSLPQLVAALAIAVAVFAGLILGTHVTLVVLVTAATLLYVAIILQRMLIHTAAYFYHDPTTVTCAPDDPDLPIYTVLVPLHDEVAIIPSHIAAMKRLEYPRERLQIIHLLESDDEATIAALEAQDLPSYFQRILIPLLGPRTKPKALNYGLASARGEYVTVYDAEDRPDPDQLLKAVALFRVAQSDVACLQARLKYAEGKRWYNRFYSVDYTTHFWELLRGLSKLNGTFPLGGTSNHFRVDDLREMAIRSSSDEPEILPAWDPSNVTEDADLAAVIACNHKRIIPLDSTTEEESPNHLFGRGRCQPPATAVAQGLPADRARPLPSSRSGDPPDGSMGLRLLHARHLRDARRTDPQPDLLVTHGRLWGNEIVDHRGALPDARVLPGIIGNGLWQPWVLLPTARVVLQGGRLGECSEDVPCLRLVGFQLSDRHRDVLGTVAPVDKISMEQDRARALRSSSHAEG